MALPLILAMTGAALLISALTEKKTGDKRAKVKRDESAGPSSAEQNHSDGNAQLGDGGSPSGSDPESDQNSSKGLANGDPQQSSG